jgi:DAPG hydrolase PhiG domain
MEFEDCNHLLDPGYLPFESGYKDLAAGKKLVAALTRMPGCRAKMVHWWFGWLGGIEQYRLWHPRDHVASAWVNRVDGSYIGASHVVSEYLAGPTGPVYDLTIDFHHPHEIFDVERYDRSGAIAVCARIGDQHAPVHVGRMCHFVRDTDYGCEMRSRFWLGILADKTTYEPVPVHIAAEARKRQLNDDFARRLHQHATEEMGYLAEILPVLYRRYTGDDAF